MNRTMSVARALGARSIPIPSAVLATLWPALEGIFVSPCSPTNISLCAGQHSGVSAAISAHQVLESAPETAGSAATLAARVCGCSLGAVARASVHGP